MDHDIKLSICKNHRHGLAKLVYIDGLGYALEDIAEYRGTIYESVSDFRDAYVPESHFRNGQQISNITVQLYDSVIGCYAHYKPLQMIEANILADTTINIDDYLPTERNQLMALDKEDLVTMIIDLRKQTD